ncbi:retrovirus-related pol polyprotein from transposon TNT 1-94 [Tanacetum coccineum]
MNNQLRTFSNARNNATVQDGRVVVHCKGIGHIARECPQPKRPQDSDYFKDKMLLMNAQSGTKHFDSYIIIIRMVRLGMIKRSKCENKGILPTEMELVLEYTQQGIEE